jgi:hypothetical protein
MTRNQEIGQAASQKVIDMFESNMELDIKSQLMYQFAFTAGAKWADGHYHWHSMNEKPERYDGYLVITKKKCYIDISHFDKDGWSESHFEQTKEFKCWAAFPNKPDEL